VDQRGVTKHDAARRDRAINCDFDSLASVQDAVRGLQSTDDPSLLPLHDALMSRMRRLQQRGEDKEIEKALQPTRMRLEIRRDLVRRNEIDEVLLYLDERCVFHLERMDADDYWFGLFDAEDEKDHFHLRIENGRLACRCDADA
jgi:hypothetical protein